MSRLALLALLALCACGQPGRLVIDDDPELVDAVMVALTDLEHEAGCKLFRRIDIGGRSKDWRGKLPPFGTVTVEVAPGNVPDDSVGHYELSLTDARARIYVRPDLEDPRGTIAHELLHALGIGHQPQEADELMSPWFTWKIGPDLMEQIQARCVDGPAGAAL